MVDREARKAIKRLAETVLEMSKTLQQLADLNTEAHDIISDTIAAQTKILNLLADDKVSAKAHS